MTKISVFKQEGKIKNKSHERCAYESVDDTSPWRVTSQKSTENEIQAVAG